MIDYIDWEFIKEKLHKGVIVFRANKGDTILDLSKRLEGVITDEDVHFYLIVDGVVRYERRDVAGKVIKSADNIPYEYFGEQAILNNKITDSANIVASDSAALLRIDRDIFLEAIERKNSALLDKLTKEMGMPNSVAEELLKEGKINTYRKYQSMSTQGKDETKFRILLKGSAFVLRNARHVAELQENDVVGDIETIKGDRKNIASVITDEDTVVLEIDIDKWDEILSKNKLYKLKLAQDAYTKERSGKLRRESDPYEIFTYEFTSLEAANQELPEEIKKSPKELEEVKDSIIQIARETIFMISETKHEDRDIQAVDDLFQFMCKSLEDQEIDDPKYFVSHGAKHSINTANYTEAIINGSETLRKNFEETYGDKALVIARLIALFHDIGYPQLKVKQEEAYKKAALLREQGQSAVPRKIYKWEHSAFSADMLKEYFPYEKFKKILKITEEEYELFIASIIYHNADNPNEKQMRLGRKFMKTSNAQDTDPETVTNVALVTMKIADNLDMIGERLSKLQKDKIFLDIFHDIYYVCRVITAEEKDKLKGITDEDEIERIEKQYRNKRKKRMKEIVSTATQPDDEVRWKEIKDNFDRIIEMDNYEGFLHFKSVSIAQNVFVREERNKIIIFIEYNEPASNLPEVLINWQSGRLKECVKNSISLRNADGEPMEIKVKQIFPSSD